MDVDFTVTGVTELSNALERLTPATQKRILRPGLRKAAALIRAQAVANLQAAVSDEATGFLARNVVVRSMRSRARGDVRVAVTIRPGEVLNPVSNARVGLYGSVLEFGKENQEPRPWLRPAQMQKGQEAVKALVETGQQRLEAVVKEARS